MTCVGGGKLEARKWSQSAEDIVDNLDAVVVEEVEEER